MQNKKQVIIDTSICMTRIGVSIDGKLNDYFVDSPIIDSSENRIIVGQVEKVVKNLEAAFIQYGASKNGMLHIKQVPSCYQAKLQQGARLPIQIKKENTGDKGHKLTSYLNVQGHYLVCMLFEPEIRLSKKIKDQETRQNIKDLLNPLLKEEYGFIVRTKAKDISMERLKEEACYLIKEADRIMQIKDNLARGSIVAKEEAKYIQVINDVLKEDTCLEIVCNDEQVEKAIKERFKHFIDGDLMKVICYEPTENVFQHYDLEKTVVTTKKSKVWLKNGGNIVIDYTEAMTVIDVNSAKAVLKKNHQKAVKELNSLAIEEAFLQMRLRNLSGMVIIDLVDMQREEDRSEVYQYAKELVKQHDKERTKVFPLTELGLMQFVRMKKHSSLPEICLTRCHTCQSQKTHIHPIESVYEIESKLKALAKNTNQKEIFCHCSEVIYGLIDKYQWQKAFEEAYNLKIMWQVLKNEPPNKYEIKYHSTNA